MSENYPTHGGRKAQMVDPDAAPNYGVHTPRSAPKAVSRRPPRPTKDRTVGRVRDAAMLSRADRVAESATLIATRLEVELRALNELRNGPSSKGFEASSASSVLYCERHECEVRDCRKAAEARNEVSTCTGVGLPPLSDPTGSAAFSDPVAKDIRVIGDELVHMERSAQLIIDTLVRYQPRRATDPERTSTAGELGCQSCSRIKGPGGTDLWWNPPRRSGPIDVGGALAKRVLLCSACESRIRETIAQGGAAELPAVRDLEVKRDTGRWPKRHQPGPG